MFGISFFKLPKAKQFGYKPIYYDPAKEERDQHLNKKDVQTNTDFSYKEKIKGSFNKSKQKAKNTDVSKNNIRLILIIVVLVILAIYFIYS